MKRKLNLIELSKNELQEMKAGVRMPMIDRTEGHNCGCACYNGTDANSSANWEYDLFSPDMSHLR